MARNGGIRVIARVETMNWEDGNPKTQRTDLAVREPFQPAAEGADEGRPAT